MATGHERYSRHAVWETLRLKRDSLAAARFDGAEQEQVRRDLVEWLDEAVKTRGARQSALYLSALDALSAALNQVPVDNNGFYQYVAYRGQSGHAYQQLEQALRMLPLPPPRDLKASYVDLLDEEVRVRNERLDQLEAQVTETESSLAKRRADLEKITSEVTSLRDVIQEQKKSIASVSVAAASEMKSEWDEKLETWLQERRQADLEHDTAALASVATLAAVTKAGESLAEHAAGDLSASDWSARAKRERRAAQWMRAAAVTAFLFAGAIGFYLVSEAIKNDFDLTLGDGVLRASIAVVIGAFGALLLRESSRHFREADTAEDVALSLKALAPFYAGSDEGVRLSARVQVGEAVLVKNVLSRFSHRDASRHAAEVNTAELPSLIKEATKALNLGGEPSAGK